MTSASSGLVVRFQSAPALITPGNLEGGRLVLSVEVFQSAPALITPGNQTHSRTRNVFRSSLFQSAPALITPGNAVSVPFSAATTYWFQSAPALITPGNPRPPGPNCGSTAVSIRPGAHHAGEQEAVPVVVGAPEFQSAPALITPGNHGSGAAGMPAICFNPPRRSSRRGTSTPTTRMECSAGTFQSAPALITPGNNDGSNV